MKIAFYLDNIKDEIDYQNYNVSNPGIGGTQYLIWTLASKLAERSNDIEVYVFTEKKVKFIKEIYSECVIDLKDAIKKAKDHNIDFFILRGPYIEISVIKYINECKLNVIVWSHNFENFRTIYNLSKCKYLVKNICVSSEQLNYLYDTKLYEKSTYIYNALNFNIFNNLKESNFDINEAKSICYMGNLYPNSGYEILLDIWKMIEKEYGNSISLKIIGSKDLYDSDKMKKRYSLKTFKRLEKKERVLYNKNGLLKENIKLYGIQGGEEKNDIMRNSHVGVANITPQGDTFGLSVVEFQALNVPVISINKDGVRETVVNNSTGILVNNKKELYKALKKILDNETLRNELSINGYIEMKRRFDLDEIIKEWEELLREPTKFNKKKDDFDKFCYDRKFIIWLNSKIKKIIPILPSIMFYKYFKYVIKRFLQKKNIY